VINHGDFIFVDDKGKMFSKPKEGRNYFGKLSSEKPIKEGTVLTITITKKGIEEVERLMKEARNEYLRF